MTMELTAIGDVLGVGRDVGAAMATGWSIDSRSVRPGDVFFAIAGPNHDGHAYVPDAFAKGALAVIVSRGRHLAEWDGAGVVFQVDDPATALADLASFARRRWAGRVVAITGSNGKTTTKEASAALLATAFRTSKTEGNLNNELGLPLSILRIADDSEAAVLEMGMNHAGEIRRLARIANPDVGVVTNVSAAHVGHFASVDEVALAKRELIEELSTTATAVLNADDERVRAFASVHDGPVLTFGFSNVADCRVMSHKSGPDGSTFELGVVEFSTRLLGVHNISNIAAAVAVATVMGLEPRTLQNAVAALAPAKMRGQVYERAGLTILDDCYNSNPAAAKAMLLALSNLAGGRKVAVLGEMRELGAASRSLHREVGRAAAAAGIELLVGVAGDAAEIIAGALEAGMPASATQYFPDAESAGQGLRELLCPGDRVLFKGSRGVGLETALESATAFVAGSA